MLLTTRNNRLFSDDCNEIRRKIRLLQKEPDFKACLALGSLRVELDVSQVTPWLKQIGGINSNSFQRFSKSRPNPTRVAL